MPDRAWSAVITALGLIGALAQAACMFGTRVSTLPAAPALRAMHSFAFVPQPRVESPTDTSLDQRLGEAVSRALRAKGYQTAAVNHADFLLSFYTNLAGPPDPESLDYPTAASERARGTPRDAARYVNVAVAINAVDPHTHQLLWRGQARTKEPPGDVSLARLTEIARSILKDFPRR